MKTSAEWIAWEKQRRTTELARALRIPLHRYLFAGPYPLRALVVSLQTAWRLLRDRPRTLVVQNPSILLAALACFLKPLLRYRLVVDRHSNFKFDTMTSRSPVWRLFHALSRYSVARADLTIVTNAFLKSVVEDWGGRGMVLPDRLPEMHPGHRPVLPDGSQVIFVCSFDADEPLDLVLEAARRLGDGTTVHITGDVRRADPQAVAGAPGNVRFTGYLPDADYDALLAAADAVLVLTTEAHTMQCGAYEAVSLGRPLVIANHEEMCQYFRQGTVVTELDAESLAGALARAIETRPRLEREMAELRGELRVEWEAAFGVLNDYVHA